MKTPYFLCEGLNGVVAFTVISISVNLTFFYIQKKYKGLRIISGCNELFF